MPVPVEEKEVVTPEAATDEVAAAVTEEESNADFESGFSGRPTAEKPPADEEKPGEKPTEEAKPAEKPAAPAEVQYRKVTEQEWADLSARAAKIDKIEEDAKKQFGTAFGKVGGLERTLRELREATPAGYTVEVTDDIVDELAAEFPELGKRTLKAFQKFAAKIKGTGSSVDPQQVEQQVSQRVLAMQLEALEEEHANWREIVGTPDTPDNEYRQWLAKQPAAYQEKLNATNSAATIARSITKFDNDKSAAAVKLAADKVVADKLAADKAKPSTRQTRLAAAATPRGTGGPASAANNENDDFEAGFKTG